jgi:RNA polymerase sigma-70 factor (ECF subfamily)
MSLSSLETSASVDHRREVADHDLVDQVRAGNASALERLFKKYYADLRAFSETMVRNRETAEDIVQAAFGAIWARHGSWNPPSGPRAYLFRACRNAAIDHLRHVRLEARTEWLVTDVVRSAATARQVRPDASVEADELRAQLFEAVDSLPERRRLVVILRWQHQLTNAEIAEILEITARGVETQFSRALGSLREWFGARPMGTPRAVADVLPFADPDRAVR